MKVCPRCQSTMRRNKTKCPFCGYKYSIINMIFDSIWSVIVMLFVIFILVLLVFMLLDFKFY